MATPSPSPSPPPPQEPPLSRSSPPRTTSKKKHHPVPWNHQETVHLIQAYQEKWYSSKRGQLKANQWEEVAETVAARCGYDDGYNHHPAKTVVQCRHKMEKLRKRYREETRRLSLNGNCFWPFFNLIDSLERGPLPISVRPLAVVEGDGYGKDGEEDDDEKEDEEEEEDEEEHGYRSRSLSINYILQKPSLVNRFAGRGDSRFLRAAAEVNKRKKEDVIEEEVDEEEGSGKRVELELAGEIRAFTERIVGMERKKIEMMKETEKWRMEMENKRVEMILDSQKKIVDLINLAFDSREDFKG